MACKPALLLLLACLAPMAAWAQDDGPRVYQLVPVGSARNPMTIFAVAKHGNETPEPGSVVPGDKIDTNIVSLSLLRPDLRDRRPCWSPFVILPVGEVESTGAPRSSAWATPRSAARSSSIGAP